MPAGTQNEYLPPLAVVVLGHDPVADAILLAQSHSNAVHALINACGELTVSVQVQEDKITNTHIRGESEVHE